MSINQPKNLELVACDPLAREYQYKTKTGDLVNIVRLNHECYFSNKFGEIGNIKMRDDGSGSIWIKSKCFAEYHYSIEGKYTVLPYTDGFKERVPIDIHPFDYLLDIVKSMNE